ncbi:phage antirepressor N-terminal domain-containing protein [Magnetococcales bacterium HHB-1]
MTGQKVVPFHGQDLIVTDYEGQPYVAMKPVVEGIGLDWPAQFTKLRKSNEKFNCCDIPMVGLDGKKRLMLCMPLLKLNGWLFSVNPQKVKSSLKLTVELYQQECFAALHNYWHHGVAKKEQIDPITAQLQQLLALRQEQLKLEKTQHEHQKKLSKQTDKLKHLESRVAQFDAETGYRTIVGFCNMRKIDAPLKFARQFGIQATNLSHQRGVKIEKVPHQMFGTCNAYCVDILEETLEQILGLDST